MERETPPAGGGLRRGDQGPVRPELPHAFANRPAGPLRGLGAVLEWLGDLTPPPEGALGERQGFHRRLGALAVPAETQGVARAVEAPVLRVVVGVDQLFRRSGDDGQA